MVNPGAFRGVRKDFLMSEKAAYAAGVEGGYAKDAVANIQRRYFKRFPLDLPHDEDPKPEYLATVDDDGPDNEPEEPDEKSMSPEEYTEAVKKLDERRKLLSFRKAVSFLSISCGPYSASTGTNTCQLFSKSNDGLLTNT